MIPFLHVWGLAIPTFGLMVALAMIAAFYVLRADLARRGMANLESGIGEYFITIPCLAGIIGARLYHALQSPADLIANPWGELFSRYGFAWFGGLIGGFAAYVAVARWKKIPLLAALDAGSPAAAFGYGVGRIGCLLSGDGDYGVPTSLPWGMSFPNGLVPTTDRVHPTPIYEFLAACAIAWILWRLGARQIRLSREGDAMRGGEMQSAGSGIVFAAYLVLTGAARFLVEFIRINPRVILGMSNAQAAGALSVLAGVMLWWWIRSRTRTARQQ
jgi:phosphatidylglycerol:prolipoprotein diacylglycerol transferase